MRTIRCSGRLGVGCLSKGVVSAQGGASAQKGGLCLGGCLPGGVHPLRTEFLTHVGENIIFPQLR